MAENRILVIDDDINLLKSAESILLQCDYQVSMAKSGKQAISFLKKELKPDLILMDVDMPELDGYETLQQIQEMKGCEGLPVIFLTGMDSVRYEIKGLEMGAVDYITKPFVKDILIARVKTHINRSKKTGMSVSEEASVIEYDSEKLEKMQKILTKTEFTVAKMIISGYTNQEISEVCHYSYGYVKRIVYQIFAKLDISKRNELRKYFIAE